MNGQQKIIYQCDKMLKLLGDAKKSLEDASKIANSYLEYRNENKVNSLKKYKND